MNHMKRNHWIERLHGAEFKVLRLQEQPKPEDAADTPEMIANFLRPRLPQSLRYSPDTECLGVICLSTRRKVIGWEIVSNGTLDTILSHPREIFKPAIIMNAAALVLFHNHPSGDPSPSDADVKVTRDLVRAGQCLRIEVLDHIILGALVPGRVRDYASLRELGAVW
jgi:DNA repair protein RadC